MLQRGLGARQAGPALRGRGHLQAQTRAVSAARWQLALRVG